MTPLDSCGFGQDHEQNRREPMSLSGSTLAKNAPTSFGRIPCYAGKIPCSYPEQGIHAYRLDMSRNKAAPADQKGQIRCVFRKFPVKFPASRESRPAKARETSENPRAADPPTRLSRAELRLAQARG